VEPFITGSYALGVSPPLVAVGRVLLLWVESGRLTHVPELFITVDYTGNPRKARNEKDMGTSQGGVFHESLEAKSNAA